MKLEYLMRNFSVGDHSTAGCTSHTCQSEDRNPLWGHSHDECHIFHSFCSRLMFSIWCPHRRLNVQRQHQWFSKPNLLSPILISSFNVQSKFQKKKTLNDLIFTQKSNWRGAFTTTTKNVLKPKWLNWNGKKKLKKKSFNCSTLMF